MSNILFYDVRKAPFRIYGLDETSTDEYRRIPRSVAESTSKNVTALSKNTAGGRIRFKTNSDKLFIRAKTEFNDESVHLAEMVQGGFDVYIKRDNGYEYCFCTKVVASRLHEYETEVFVLPGEKELTINMPLYGNVLSLEIGLCEGATLEAHSDYKYEKPIVFYGSSITQGGCVSRNGKVYSAIISRKYDTNFRCLGFSGSAMAEDAIVDYMAGLDMAAFVSDYDHNAPTVEHLKATHHKMYQKIREKNPDIPYFMVTKPDFKYEDNCFARRAVVMESYLQAYNSGDKNVYFIDGSAFFNGMPMSDATVDRCHPTDDGQRRMADYIGDVIAKVMKL